MPMSPDAVRPLHPRRHRALDASSRRSAASSSTECHGAQHQGRGGPNAPPVTRMLAEFVATHPSRGWDATRSSARRIGRSSTGSAARSARRGIRRVEAALAARAGAGSPSPQAIDPRARASASTWRAPRCVNGIASHTFDFDDTHLATIIHPGRPRRLGGARARRAPRRSRDAQLLDAIVLGIDVACRVGNAIYPDHYDRGWHITGSTGMLGAAAACRAAARARRASSTAMALGIAASQPIGVREQFGSMTKPFHPGGAARAGLMSALLATTRLHRVDRGARSAARLDADLLDEVRLERDHRRARQALRDRVQHATSRSPAAS